MEIQEAQLLAKKLELDILMAIHMFEEQTKLKVFDIALGRKHQDIGGKQTVIQEEVFIRIDLNSNL